MRNRYLPRPAAGPARLVAFGVLVERIRGMFKTKSGGRWYDTPTTQAELAEIAGVSRVMITHIEAGRKRMSHTAWERVCKHFRIRVEGPGFDYSAHHGSDRYMKLHIGSTVKIIDIPSGNIMLDVNVTEDKDTGNILLESVVTDPAADG